MADTYQLSYSGQQIDTAIGKANTAVQPADLEAKQDVLVSGENIKTINNQSILGEGNINISGGGGAKFTYNISADVQLHEKTKELIDVSNIETSPSWSEVEDAIDNEEDIEINLDFNEPDRYLYKYASLDTSEVYQGSVELLSEGSMIGVELNNLQSGDKNPGDAFSLVITTEENNAIVNTYNRLVIEGSMSALDNMEVVECYAGEGKDRIDLATYKESGTIFTEIFQVSGDDNMPVIHIKLATNSYIEQSILSIGYERYEDYDDFSQYSAHRNDDEHDGGTTNYKLTPNVIVEEGGRHLLEGHVEDNIIKIKCGSGYVRIENTLTYDGLKDLNDEIKNLSFDTETIEINNGYLNSHTSEHVIDALYDHDLDSGRYELREAPLPVTIMVNNDNGDKASIPACFDYTGLQLPSSSYSYNEIENTILDVKIHGQMATKTYTIKTIKELYLNPYPEDSYDTSGVDTSGMLAVTATFDSGEYKWTFDKSFNEIFNNETKQSGILLTVVNMYDYDSNRGYDVEYDDKEDIWNTIPITYQQPLVFQDDHFIGTYNYSQYHEDYGNVEWESTIAIEVDKKYTYTVQDLAAVPTVSIIANLTTNLNGFVLQTFTASELQTDGTYSWYEIERNNEPCSFKDAQDYMEYMTGSRFVPIYNLSKPLNSIMITAQMQFLKPQFGNDGLKLYVLPVTLPGV